MSDPQPQPSLTRRVFVRTSIAAAGACYAAALGYPVYQYLATAARKAEAESAVKEVTLDNVEALPVPSALVFKFGGHPALLIRHANNEFTALSAVCTHLGCTVQFDPAKQNIFCACHGGEYDAKTGANVSGPPPKPLTQFKVAIDNGKAVVSRA